MIGKVVRLRAGRAGSFKGLVRYLLRGRAGVERVASTRVSNCESADPQWAAVEIEATQQANQRCGSERTYHLLLSFPPGERPDAATLAAIEDRVVQALGFGEHQRVSAVHTDTDHLHIHVAINKIHPRRLTVHTPLRDFETLGRVCAALEVEFGLQATNHQRVRFSAAGADDMEAIGARESLQGFIRRECAAQVAAADSWPAVHAVLARHGVVLKARGAGLVFVSRGGEGVRASSVERGFSLKAMERRLGPFQRSSEMRIPTKAGRTRRARWVASRGASRSSNAISSSSAFVRRSVSPGWAGFVSRWLRGSAMRAGWQPPSAASSGSWTGGSRSACSTRRCRVSTGRTFEVCASALRSVGG